MIIFQVANAAIPANAPIVQALPLALARAKNKVKSKVLIHQSEY